MIGCMKKLTVICAVLCCIGSIMLSNQCFAQEFKITYPKTGESINTNPITVEGEGAVSGGRIKMEVYTDKWYTQRGTATIYKNGKWTYDDCYCSGQGPHSIHKIRATLIVNGSPVSYSQVGRIVRKNN